jgi:dihydroorotate dehydrogenase
MADLSTQYLGLKLKNPIIAGSSGLTNSAKSIKELEAGGAGAVVLKSIFEEEIAFEYDDILKEAESKGYDLDQFDYYDYKIKEDNLNKYTTLISESKNSVSIPVIASVNCVYSHEWLAFASQLEKAGADALELNMFFLPSDFERTSEEKEAAYFQIIEKVQKAVSIPISLKISYYFSNLGPMIQKLSETGIAGLVLFNRFFSPDFIVDGLFRSKIGVRQIGTHPFGVEFLQSGKPRLFADREMQAQILQAAPVQSRLGVERRVVIAKLPAVGVYGFLQVIGYARYEGKVLDDRVIILQSE